MSATRTGRAMAGGRTYRAVGATDPVYNMKAVVLRTGVPADTVRAWERRYHVPHPKRTAGGQRAYSEYDIAVIRWLRQRTEEGMTISQAVSLLNTVGLTLAAPPTAASVPPESRSCEAMTRDLVAAFRCYDGATADHLIGEAFVLYGVEAVFLQVLCPALVEIGEQWHRGALPVTVEHFASQFVKRKVIGLTSLYDNRHAPWTIVIGCPPNEFHEMGALLLSLFMLRQGWAVIYLGPDVPIDDLLEVVRSTAPDMVCISASRADGVDGVARIGEALAAPDVPHRPLYGYGGLIFNERPELRARVAGLFLGEDARAGVAAAYAALVAR